MHLLHESHIILPIFLDPVRNISWTSSHIASALVVTG
jgi:hypothetical protein